MPIMKYQKKKLLSITRKIIDQKKVSPEEINCLLSFDTINENSKVISYIKKCAVPIALCLGFLIAVFPKNVKDIALELPSWTNLPEPMQNGFNYIWNILSEPVDEHNIIFHLPNIILYSFGFLGVKKLFDAIEKHTWIDKVFNAKQILTEKINEGTLLLDLPRGHSVLFEGNGDFIATQLFLNSPANHAVIISTLKPNYTHIWNRFDPTSSFEDLEAVIERICNHNTGEYIFFPVKDDQIFLPSNSAYDLSPHKMDILCQDIRLIEKRNKWKPKKILIVGDKFHTSYVHSEDYRGKIDNSEDIISLKIIASRYPHVSIVDPTDIVLQQILDIADGRKIAFRATKEGQMEYKDRFYERLQLIGYKKNRNRKGILTIGYDLFEDQTEQQTLSGKVDDYYPVVLSKSVRDALIRNGYKKNEFIYVPELVLDYLKKEASKQ